MFSRKKSFVLSGIDCQEVEIETDKTGGLHNFHLVGFPDLSVKESKERVTSAIKNCGFKPPYHFGRITVSLAPSYLKKTGSGLDLPIAVSILEATEQIPVIKEEAVFVGELSLDGSLKDTPGILPVVIAAKQSGYQKLFIPLTNVKEALLIRGVEIIPLCSINDYIAYLKDGTIPKYNIGISTETPECSKKEIKNNTDLSLIKGHEKAKRALTIVASGSHNILFCGSPGTGKTLLAKALPSLLPKLTERESLEVTKIYSAAGLLSKDQPLINKQPFRDPHHTASEVALVGGGSKITPGEITLAHRGVLFLDEILEFSRKSLNSLRQPLEEGSITISRATGSVTFPAKIILIAAMNPCPCGYSGDPKKECTCSPSLISKYRNKLSGPIIDRIDLFVKIGRVKYQKLKQGSDNSNLNLLKNQIKKTKAIQYARFKKTSILNNSEMGLEEVELFCQIDKESNFFLKKAMEKFNLSTRSYYRILKVARTIADLEGNLNIKKNHLAEALQFQLKDY